MEINHNLDFPDEEGQEEGNHNGTAASTPQQLRILQSLLPTSTKTDARSILEDASDYLKRIHQEMEQIEEELSKRTSEDSGSSSSGRPSSTDPSPAPNKILRVETEKVGQSRFVVKIISKKGSGVAAQVQRVFESLEMNVNMTSLAVQDKNPYEMLTTALVQVTKDMPMTEEKLHGLITNGMERLGLVQH